MTHPPAGSSAVRLDALTGLRWWAAFMVFLFHMRVFAPLPGPLAAVFDQGYLGVTFFFVLSGFVLTWAIRPGSRTRDFYQSRFARIYPLYLATWAAAVAASFMLGDDKSRDIPFLGEPAPFPVGPWRLAAMLAAPVVFMAGCYLGGNRYQLVFEPIIDFAQVPAEKRASAMQEAQDRFVELLESRCRQAPWNWFNFYDFWHAQT